MERQDNSRLSDDELPKVRRPESPPEQPVDSESGEQTTSPTETGDPDAGAALPGEKSRGRMRHVPSRDWFLERIDRKLRTELDLFYQLAFTTSHENREVERRVEANILDTIHHLDRITYLCGGNLSKKENEHLRVALEKALSEAEAALGLIDPDDFGRRASSQDFHGSPWESIWASWLAIEWETRKALELLQTIEPDATLTILERTAPATAPKPEDLDAIALSVRE